MISDHYLSKLFTPESVALIGASEREGSIGRVLARNFVDDRFSGRFFFINPKHKKVFDNACYKDVGQLPISVDLAVITTPARTVTGILAECGQKNISFVAIISAGFGETGEQGKLLEDQVLKEAEKYGIRILGPNCLGMIRAPLQLNATFFEGKILKGHLALISQSGAICTAILDWAQQFNIGFSSVVSMGDATDLDFGEILDFFALDPQTRCILLYIEGIQETRPFMSALRQAARLKPVIVLKAGKSEGGNRAALSHTGAIAGSDSAFHAALERAGAIHVHTVDQLFNASAILSRFHNSKADDLLVLTNGGGLGVLAADAAHDYHVKLAELSEDTVKALNEFLPAYWSRANPIDILGDATALRYREAIRICLKEAKAHALLIMFAPQAISDATEIAKVVIEEASSGQKPILTCWMGGAQVQKARELFIQNNIPFFDSPNLAVEAFSFLSQFQNNQELLLQVPAPLSIESESDLEGAKALINDALKNEEDLLPPPATKALLKAFKIPVTAGIRCQTPQEALIAAEEIGFPVTLKIDSPQIIHKSDVGGVILNVQDAYSLKKKFHELLHNVQQATPSAIIGGVMVEKMVLKNRPRELMVGVSSDEVFGRLISFGLGGTWVEVIGDQHFSLPPLNEKLIENLIQKSRANQVLGPFRGSREVDRKALHQLLMRVSEMVCELPEIKEIDLNPVLVDELGAMVVDARVILNRSDISLEKYSHLAISPYPSELKRKFQLPDGQEIVIRPIRPEDALIEETFVNQLSAESKYFRFMGALQHLSRDMLIRFTQIDYDREMAFIAVVEEEGKPKEIGVARYATNPDRKSCEFAIVVADQWQGQQIGTELMKDLLSSARKRGFKTMKGEILVENHKMINFVKKLNFDVKSVPEGPELRLATKTL